ncbi:MULTISPECIES: hypothetical protein [Bacillus]|uniref:DUF6060 domain-containing protein n=1 Tax=Bacillus TaxID=1386 RepID=UPI0007506806|nr:MULTISPECIES: hypothetical protein [Bacillus]BDG81096.1 hypothetical protein BSF_28250 [Bacillus subtilis]KUP34670.1 hypothetical protein AU387_09635 [Bacillus halotolerans]KUP38624.1 hypothetical protein AU385_20460 [Bacillus halotolerans]MBL4969771.1 hypothetical protein [Bacillus halotolerans]MBL4973833.1 hypothetical protein [Bacillus halotolerans]
MKKKVAFLITVCVVCLMIFGNPTKGFAAEQNTINLSDSNVEKFYDEEQNAVIAPFKATENGLVPVSKDEYEKATKTTENEDLENEFVVSEENNDEPGFNAYADVDIRTWRYKEKSATKYYGNPIKVSASIKCTSSSCRVDKQWQATVSKSYSVNASSEIKAINYGASFNFTSAKSSSSTYSFTIKKGQSGYIAFKPYKRKSTGTLTQYSTMHGKISSKSAYGRSAIKLRTGEADGYYSFVFTKK